MGLLDSGRGPEGRRRGGRSPSPGSLGVRDGAGRGRTPGGLRPASAARRGVARTWLSPQHQAVAAAAILPSTPCRRRSPPRVSRMWAFPGVACAGAEDWGLQAAPLGPGASAWLAASCMAARPSPRVRVSIACGLQSPEEWSRYHRILALHRDVTQARRYECGSHRERAVSGAPRPRTFGGKTCRAWSKPKSSGPWRVRFWTQPDAVFLKLDLWISRISRIQSLGSAGEVLLAVNGVTGPVSEVVFLLNWICCPGCIIDFGLRMYSFAGIWSRYGLSRQPGVNWNSRFSTFPSIKILPTLDPSTYPL